MTRPLSRLAPHQPPAASNKYGPWLFKRYNRAATAKQPPAERAPAPPPATKLPGLLFLWATAASRGPSPVLEPTLTPIGKMCVFQVSKYCHLPESSMAGPFKRGEGGLRIAPARLPGCLATGVHVASHSNRSIGRVKGILQAQLESANQTYLYGSSAFSRLGRHFQL